MQMVWGPLQLIDGNIIEMNLNISRFARPTACQIFSLSSPCRALSFHQPILLVHIPEAFGDYLELTLIDLSDNSLSGENPRGNMQGLRKLRRNSTEHWSIEKITDFFRAGGRIKMLRASCAHGDSETATKMSCFKASPKPAFLGVFLQSIGMLKRIQTISQFTLTAIIRLLSQKRLEDLRVSCRNLYLYQEFLYPVQSLGRKIGETSASFRNLSNRKAYQEAFGNLLKLEELQLSVNQLSGTIPVEITNCTALTHLEVDNNGISGEIPAGIRQPEELDSILCLEEQSHRQYPESLSECVNLQALDLSYNSLFGNCTNLYRLRLNGNMLGGTIPSEIEKLKSLNFIDLSNNLLVGGIPSSVSGCENLEFLDLHSNGISGSVPDTLPKRLQYVDVSDNRLTGSLTHSIGSLIELTKLNLAKNQLSGGIPAEILSCSKLQLLNLGDNDFSGEIPKELGQIPSLEISLNLSCNQFSGKIPSQFSDLSKLGVLDISHNKLEGSLDVLANLQNLVSLNVSFNDFSGELPNTPCFRKLPISDLASNQGLYISGGVATPADHLGPGANTRSAMRLLMSVLLSAGVVLILLTIYMLVRARVDNHGLMEDDTWEMNLYQKLEFSVNDIVKNLRSSNVIGTGSSGVVYRVTLPNWEMIAVKKMWSSEESGAFNSEIRTLGSIRHRNIVRLLGWCSNKKLKLLFYDYLPNGSLSSLLHGAGKGGAEWEARYDVLLGPGYEPYLADFGLARVVNNKSDDDLCKPSPRPQLAGSYGYMAPEHASMQRITEKSDVYSFGVVLLEVLTGRHPLDPTLPDGAHLVQWVREHLASKKDPVDILDSKLRGRAEPTMHEMLQTLAVSILCISTRADDSPMMKDVVAMLKEIRHVETVRPEPDLSKGVNLTAVRSSPPPAKIVVSQGSSNCPLPSQMIQSNIE
ncbi:hypothetical protein NC653_028406 [Populus alba x Populus x berolinensis]|uniref:Protein kinase domain-containing protein n=1 Tax=Populus alba x Populus x berolinensis TaxID=444605 RepID=A0AAD6M8H8_9ROSI|nr:hypothetical protein NC653_028406 [Populus alba x Populus x berolinensis]